MEKFEYKWINLNIGKIIDSMIFNEFKDLVIIELNKLGQENWEIISFYDIPKLKDMFLLWKNHSQKEICIIQVLAKRKIV